MIESSGLPILDFVEPTHVTHIAYVSLSIDVYYKEEFFLASGGIDWHKMIYDTELSQGFGFGGGLRCRQFPLQDIPLPSSRLVVGLFNFLKL